MRPSDAAAANGMRRAYLPDALLAALVLLLAILRFFGALGYATYRPLGMRLLEGLPASWEAQYFTDQLPLFLADTPVRWGIAPVDYRTYIQMYVFAQLTGWVGSTFWPLAAVDLLFWLGAVLATYRIGLRLGSSTTAATVGAVLTAGSPIYAAQMWRQDLHLANLASLPLGLWVALVHIQERRTWWGLVGGLAFVFLALSLTYQYQWFLAPVVLALMAFQRGIGLRRGAVALAGAAALFAAATGVLRTLIAFSALEPRPDRLAAVQQPLAVAGEIFGSVTDLRSMLTALPGQAHVATTALAYHPVIYALGLAGLVLLERRGMVMGGISFVLPLLFLRLHPPPWVGMTAYPLVYVGAGQSVALLFGRVPAPWRAGLFAAAALLLFALTNGGLWGDPRFLLQWWDLYSPRPIY